VELQEKVEMLENVISKGRLMVANLQSDVADLEAQLAEADAERNRLESEQNERQSSLEAAVERAGSLQAELATSQHQLEAANTRADEQQADAETKARAFAGRETELAEAKDKLRDIEDWCEFQDERYNRLDLQYEYLEEDLRKTKEQHAKELAGMSAAGLHEARRRIAELEVELAQKSEAVSRLEAQLQSSAALEAEKQKLHTESAELNRQLAEEQLRTNRAETKLVRATDKWVDKLKKQMDEIAKLTEDKRNLQTTVRRQQNALDDTYAGPSASAAAAAKPAPPPPQPATVVEQWCITHYEAEVTRLKRELEKKEQKIQELSNYIRHVKKREVAQREAAQREALRPLQPTTPPNQ